MMEKVTQETLGGRDSTDLDLQSEKSHSSTVMDHRGIKLQKKGEVTSWFKPSWQSQNYPRHCGQMVPNQHDVFGDG